MYKGKCLEISSKNMTCLINISLVPSRPVHRLLKKGVKFKGFYKEGYRSKENSDFEAKIRGVNSVPGDKLHDFEIICPARGCVCTLLPPPHSPCIRACPATFIFQKEIQEIDQRNSNIGSQLFVTKETGSKSDIKCKYIMSCNILREGLGRVPRYPRFESARRGSSQVGQLAIQNYYPLPKGYL